MVRAERAPLRAAAARAYLPPAGLILYVAVFLWVDSRLQSIAEQAVLGIGTFVLLVVSGALLRPCERRQLCVLIAFATALELFASQVWGVYRYRFGNVPFYIPPGHGVVFVLSLWLARTPLMAGSPLAAKRLVLVAASAWAVAGLTVLPALTGRLDMEGALLWPIFCFVVLRTERGLFFAAVFLVTSAVEIYGVALGDWSWTPVAPHLRLTAGNPPSVIAGAYCILDASVFGALTLAGAARRLGFPRIARRAPSAADSAARPWRPAA